MNSVTVQTARGLSTSRYSTYTPSWMIPWKTGRFYICPFATTINAVAAGSTTNIYFTPIYVPNPAGVTLTNLGCELTTAGAAGSLARIALYEYADHETLGALVQDSGSFATDGSPGYVSGTVSKLLRQGYYYGAFACTGGTFRFMSVMVPSLIFGVPAPLLINSNNEVFTVAWGATSVANIVNNGFPNRIIIDSVNSNGVASSPKIILGI